MRPRLAPDGRAHGELVLAGGSACQKENGYVAAADQEKEGDRTEEQVQCAAQVMDVVLVQAHNVYAELLQGKVLRGLVGKSFDKRLQCCVGLRMGNAWLEPCADIEPKGRILRDLLGHVDIGVEPCEARRGHSPTMV